MAQEAKVFAAKHYYPSLIPGISVVEEENQLPWAQNPQVVPRLLMHTHTHKQININFSQKERSDMNFDDIVYEPNILKMYKLSM